MDPNNAETTGTSNAGRSWLTLSEALEELEDLEAERDAVLGGLDDKNCTYIQGYLGRQALYACMTCMPESRVNEDKRAGVCLACAHQCHEGHELIELYTKRKFRCDCGSKRMPDIRCKLDPLKLTNDLNQYNQNFIGSFCTCKRPNPDPEDTVSDEMIQCVVCEDWYHTRHLDTDDVPTDRKGFAEMICGGCVQRAGFLRNYVGKIEDGNRPPLSDAKRAWICIKPPLEEGEGAAYKKGATFWNDGWRNQLCRCMGCLAVYKKLKVEFLLDDKDTVKWYEENVRAKRHNESLIEQGTAAWNRMDRVQQVEILSGVNLMRDRLREFLDTFVASRQVVTGNDVREFFAELHKERSEMGGTPSHFCR